MLCKLKWVHCLRPLLGERLGATMQRLILRYFQPVLLWLQSKVQDIWPWCFTVPQFMVTMLQQHVVHHGCYFLSSGGSYSAELLVRTEKLATYFFNRFA